MGAQSRRITLAAVALVGVWIVTYWLWPENGFGDRPAITFDSTRPAANIPTNPGQTPAESSLVEKQSDSMDEAPVDVDIPDPIGANLLAADMPRDTGAFTPPEFRTYTVRSGDDIMSIAKREYGSHRQWQAIAKANPLVDLKKLYVGQSLRLPIDPKNIQGRPATTKADDEPGAPTEPAQIEYIVVPGDTLSEIASRFYGSALRWRVIRDANRDRVNEDGTNIRPGMTLVIPPAPNKAKEQAKPNQMAEDKKP